MKLLYQINQYSYNPLNKFTFELEEELKYYNIGLLRHGYWKKYNWLGDV